MDLKTKGSFTVVPFCAIIYAWFAVVNGFPYDFSQAVTLGKTEIMLKGSIPSIAFYFVALVLTYVIPSGWKHRLIYMRWDNALPGHRAFTKLVHKDSRIARDGLEAEYGILPEEPSAQNVLWYMIYKRKQADEVVKSSQGRWLLFRDLFSILAVVLIPSCFFTFWHSGVMAGALFLIVSVPVLIILWICAYNTGERFVCNVLAR